METSLQEKHLKFVGIVVNAKRQLVKVQQLRHFEHYGERGRILQRMYEAGRKRRRRAV